MLSFPVSPEKKSRTLGRLTSPERRSQAENQAEKPLRTRDKKRDPKSRLASPTNIENLSALVLGGIEADVCKEIYTLQNLVCFNIYKICKLLHRSKLKLRRFVAVSGEISAMKYFSDFAE